MHLIKFQNTFTLVRQSIQCANYTDNIKRFFWRCIERRVMISLGNDMNTHRINAKIRPTIRYPSIPHGRIMFISFGLLLWYRLEMLNLIYRTETKPKQNACIDSVYTKESTRHMKAFVKCVCIRIKAVVIFKGDNKTQRLLIVCCQYSNKFQ